MARLARGEYLNPFTIQIVHTIQRCVRRAFLCGNDPVSGRDLEHRRQWIRDRLEFLASVFAIDCLTYTVMSNHLHLILRSRPDIVRSWSDEQVAIRWLRLFPSRRDVLGHPVQPTQEELNQIILDPSRVAEIRKRLSDISWWMRCTSENIARRANREDEVTGHFWEGRYKAQLLLDEAAILACAMYVDLNPIRAAIAESPETAKFTGAYDRIQDIKSNYSRQKAKPVKHDTVPISQARNSKRWERSRRRVHCGWLSPLEIDESNDPIGADVSDCGRRASLKGFLSLSLNRYLELLDWTGRQLVSGKRGQVPKRLQPILQRLGIETQQWNQLVNRFGKLFKRVVGTPQAIHQEATRRGQGYFQAPGATLLAAAD